MHRVSLPLVSSSRCSSVSLPSLKPSFLPRISINVQLTSAESCTKGRMVFSMRAFTVEGYVRWTGLGHASASSWEMLMNSTVSRAPVSSTAFAPAALYLHISGQSIVME